MADKAVETGQLLFDDIDDLSEAASSLETAKEELRKARTLHEKIMDLERRKILTGNGRRLAITRLQLAEKEFESCARRYRAALKRNRAGAG